MAEFTLKSDGIKIENSTSELTILPSPGNTVEVTAPSADGVLATLSDIGDKADLVGGVVPANQLPAGYGEEILYGTYINSTTFNDLSAVPYTPILNRIYVDTVSDLIYRWGGISYVGPLNNGLALGETNTTAYRGDRGKTAYDHTSLTNNPHAVTAAQVGLDQVDNTADADKEISIAALAEFDKKLPKKVEFKEINTNYTLILADRYKILVCTNVSDIVITIPSAIFEDGDHLTVIRKGTGEVDFQADGGVTVRVADNAMRLRVRYSPATIVQETTNNFYLYGDLIVVS